MVVGMDGTVGVGAEVVGDVGLTRRVLLIDDESVEAIDPMLVEHSLIMIIPSNNKHTISSYSPLLTLKIYTHFTNINP